MRVVFFFGAVLLVILVALFVRDRIAEIDVSETAARVEKLRGLEFTETPEAVLVSQETASEGIWTFPESEQAMLELLGLAISDEELDAANRVWGSYTPWENRIEIADDGPRSGPMFEMILAHELAHALDDQHHGSYDTEDMSNDAELAVQALSEGSAMLVERDYADRYLEGKRPEAGAWPPGFAWRDTRFVYDGGEEFVAALRAGGGWERVASAMHDRPPESSEQVLHPEKWLTRERPVFVETPLPKLGAGWTRVDADVWGEWRTGALVGERLATGWGGDRFELWRRGKEHTLVMTWAWDTSAGARALADGLRSRPFMRRPGAQVWHEGDKVTLVLAPSDAVAARVG